MSVKYSVHVEEIEYILEDFFKRLKSWITSPKMPTVKISNFGSFKPSFGNISRSLKGSIRAYRLGYTSYKEAADAVSNLWPIRKRLQKEEQKKETWKKWHKMKLEKDSRTAGLRLPRKTDES